MTIDPQWDELLKKAEEVGRLKAIVEIATLALACKDLYEFKLKLAVL